MISVLGFIPLHLDEPPVVAVKAAAVNATTIVPAVASVDNHTVVITTTTTTNPLAIPVPVASPIASHDHPHTMNQRNEECTQEK